MDEQMIARLLQSYGAPMTSENAAAARQFFASNPDVAERRAMGMRGSGIDDNSDVFRPAMDKLMQVSAAPQQPVQSPPQPAAASPSPVRQQIPPRPQATAPSSAQYGPPVPQEYPYVQPMPPASAPIGAPQMQQQAAPSNDNSLWQWLLPLLGVAAMPRTQGNLPVPSPTNRGALTEMPQQGGPEARYAGPIPRGDLTTRNEMMPATQSNAPNGQERRMLGYEQKLNGPPNAPKQIEAPQKRIEDRTTRGNYESVGNEIDTVNNRNASAKAGQERGVQESVDAENESAKRLQEQMRNRMTREDMTSKTLRAAKKTFGGR